MVEIIEYDMRPGEYIEDRDIGALAEEHLDPNPIIEDYEWKVIDNGSRKDTLGFGVDFMNPKEGLEQYDVDTFDDALKRVNDFLKAVTGRRAELRKNDMKQTTKSDL